MSASTNSKMQSSLAQKMALPGGLTVAEALVRGERGLQSHREAGLATMGALLVWLEAAVSEQGGESGKDVYRVAAELLDLAGFFDTSPLYRATFSLCDIADCMLTTGNWDWPSVDVHVRAMRLIMADGCRDNENSQTILNGLMAIGKRLK